ncbi:VOC family protein [Actinokineospora guangxiensis]|uniref:VOC family protein n=1 Tax=Actinokineospora guangxiensis TaxID=1490288 RepID=A0ABW0ETJ1_9PSEU
MRVQRVSLAAQVADVRGGAAFYTEHFAFRPTMVWDHVAKLVQPDTDFELVLLPGAARAGGVIIALEVADVRAEAERLAAAGIATGPVQDEEWGERLCQVRDPNGLTVQLVQWLGERPA